MRIAVDAMGGDYAPEPIVHGALKAACEVKGEILLVGIPDEVKKHIPGTGLPKNVSIIPATQVIGMDETPTTALRQKKDSSLSICAKLVKDGEAEAMVSAGNTGAATASALLSWRQIAGIHRPAIATAFPCKHGRFLLLDAGASPDVDPIHMVEFAIMGRAYAELVMERTSANVHLLNIGEEPAKGNAFAKEAYSLLTQHNWFAGNIEGKDIFRKPVDVVVCDAFVGNIVLKSCEGVAEFIMDEIRSSIPNGIGKYLFVPMKSALKPLRKKMDYAEYGGSPLLGLNGICIISHGRSNAKAIHNAVLNAAKCVESDVVGSIRTRVAQQIPGKFK
ncbi:MAG: phosphate acyltransferase PlsX [Fimbriimonadaceae bacterium]|nr:MAG: phosphate acyltransferase PlsX [Fimbriimonadaceae bacterium]